MQVTSMFSIKGVSVQHIWSSLKSTKKRWPYKNAMVIKKKVENHFILYRQMNIAARLQKIHALDITK